MDPGGVPLGKLAAPVQAEAATRVGPSGAVQAGESSIGGKGRAAVTGNGVRVTPSQNLNPNIIRLTCDPPTGLTAVDHRTSMTTLQVVSWIRASNVN